MKCNTCLNIMSLRNGCLAVAAFNLVTSSILQGWFLANQAPIRPSYAGYLRGILDARSYMLPDSLFAFGHSCYLAYGAVKNNTTALLVSLWAQTIVLCGAFCGLLVMLPGVLVVGEIVAAACFVFFVIRLWYWNCHYFYRFWFITYNFYNSIDETYQFGDFESEVIP